MQLFTVSFITKTAVTKVEKVGRKNVSRRIETETPITIDGLTREKAEAYAANPGFKMVPYNPASKLTAKGTGRDSSIGNGVKHAHRASAPVAQTSRTITSKGAGSQHGSIVTRAARTGNLTAAINA